MNEIKYELICESQAIDTNKDILIIVHNQLEYTRQCIESIQANTKNYNLYIWDNNSNKETREYLETLDATLCCSNKNTGFIFPNNALAKLTDSDYIILLNNDTVELALFAVAKSTIPSLSKSPIETDTGPNPVV